MEIVFIRSECRREPCAFFSPKKNLALSLRKASI